MGEWNGPPHEPQFLCGARAKHNGKSCRQFAMRNGRCYYHGGCSTGAKKPLVKHGQYTKESIELRKQSADLMRDSKALIKEMDE